MDRPEINAVQVSSRSFTNFLFTLRFLTFRFFFLLFYRPFVHLYHAFFSFYVQQFIDKSLLNLIVLCSFSVLAIIASATYLRLLMYIEPRKFLSIRCAPTGSRLYSLHRRFVCSLVHGVSTETGVNRGDNKRSFVSFLINYSSLTILTMIYCRRNQRNTSTYPREYNQTNIKLSLSTTRNIWNNFHKRNRQFYIAEIKVEI